jgi:hydrogenase maturation protein HypF
MRMYAVDWRDVLVACDAHPEYASTVAARALPAGEVRAVQHHRAHVASVLAERGVWDQRVLGLACDGTGYGDDGTTWGSELFVGSVRSGFARVAHLRPSALPGGDAAAVHPVQAAAGVLADLEHVPDLSAPPFAFPRRFGHALQLVRRNLRTFETTSMGRLFDAAAALCGFTRAVTFEGQAAMWLEHQARRGDTGDAYPCPFDGTALDFQPLLREMIADRRAGRRIADVALAFHHGLAAGLVAAATRLCTAHDVHVVVASGGVFQNELFLAAVDAGLMAAGLPLWTNHHVPPNDGGVSLGQAALAALGPA